jgi:hypothetical protein
MGNGKSALFKGIISLIGCQAIGRRTLRGCQSIALKYLFLLLDF